MRNCVLLASVLLLSFPASAKDMNGKFGVGFTQTLGGVSGVSFRYWAGRQLGVETVFSLSRIDRADLRSSTQITGAVGLIYSFVQHRHANLSVGLRADIGFRDSPAEAQGLVSLSNAIDSQVESVTAEAKEATVHINVEIPLIVEFFLSDSFSVDLAVGIVIIFVPAEGAILSTSGPGATESRDEFGFGLGNGGLLGSAGFTFYF